MDGGGRLSDWLDDLLYELPSDPCPASLTARIHVVLARQRRWERWRRIGGHAALAGGSAAGFLWFIASGMLPQPAVDLLRAWSTAILLAPLAASQSVIASAASWETGVAFRLTDSVVVVLLVLAAAGAWALPQLLQSSKSPSEVVR
jgi:hypothetical protein